MKTSNIIIIGAVAAYLLFVGWGAASQLGQLDDSYPYARLLASGLDTTRIHTVIAEGDEKITINNYQTGIKSIGTTAVPTNEHVRISGDTLFIRRIGTSIHIPELENFMLNGTEQRLPTEEEWRVTYQYDKIIESRLRTQ